MVHCMMAKIKVIVATGVAFPDAVKAALGMSIREFSGKNGVDESTVSAVINGSTPYTYERVRNVLAEQLGVEREWIDEQLSALRSAAPAGEGAA
jgi:transcriptional regulator with XRE-family HTH domain